MIKNKKLVYFDIETEGFSSWTDSLVCAAILKEGDFVIEKDLFEIMEKLKSKSHNSIIITYNGEGYRKGFDFPFLRSKCIQEGVEWELAGVKHLDLLPLVRKYINTTHYVTEIPSKRQLKAADLKKLARANDIDYQNKNETYKLLKKLRGRADWLDYIEPKSKEDNSLQAVYQMMLDPEEEEEYIEGGRIPEIYEEIQRIKANLDDPSDKLVMYDESDIEGLWQKIKDHNRRDVERLKKIAEKVIPVIPDWEIKRNINKL